MQRLTPNYIIHHKLHCSCGKDFPLPFTCEVCGPGSTSRSKTEGYEFGFKHSFSQSCSFFDIECRRIWSTRQLSVDTLSVKSPMFVANHKHFFPPCLVCEYIQGYPTVRTFFSPIWKRSPCMDALLIFPTHCKTIG